MGTDKLSVSFDEDLATVVREAATDEGTTVSAWLAAAAHDRVRNRLLKVALDELAAELGPIDPDEAARLVAEARRTAIVTSPSDQAA